MSEKTISAIIIVGGNPVYNAPVDLDFAAKLKTVPNVVRVGFYEDETSDFVTWHAPLAHYLESWGDGIALDGSYVSVQPMILPLYGGWSELEVLARFAGLARTDGPELVQETFKDLVKPNDFTAVWAKFLHDGARAQRRSGRKAGRGKTPDPCARRKLIRGRARRRFKGGRRTIRQQRLAPGAARSDHETDLGQRRADQPGDREETRHRHRG
jgi:anaerobic selenocysteine-containing dehydrogenase